jgi:hypothetical protein
LAFARGFVWTAFPLDAVSKWFEHGIESFTDLLNVRQRFFSNAKRKYAVAMEGEPSSCREQM